MPRLQFRLSTLLWITLAAGVLLWMVRPSKSIDVHTARLLIIYLVPVCFRLRI
ncbi:MAG TPA: hypothetical protein VND64_04515 [Pirellulales bacterium]|nr:hypothetical protein [Pirellulales bacterium]